MKPIAFWAPAACCGVISMLGLLGSKMDSVWWRPAFFGFLPFCFLLLGSIMYRMHRDISRLRHRVARLEYRRQAGEGREPNRQPASAKEPGSVDVPA